MKTFKEYSDWVQGRNFALRAETPFLCAMGLVGEAGEVMAAALRVVASPPMPAMRAEAMQALTLELGDTWWYFALTLRTLDWDLLFVIGECTRRCDDGDLPHYENINARADELLVIEAAKACEAWKKHLLHKKPLDKMKMLSALAGVYHGLRLLEARSSLLSAEVWQANVDKLEKRYGK